MSLTEETLEMIESIKIGQATGALNLSDEKMTKIIDDMKAFDHAMLAVCGDQVAGVEAKEHWHNAAFGIFAEQLKTQTLLMDLKLIMEEGDTSHQAITSMLEMCLMIGYVLGEQEYQIDKCSDCEDDS